MKDSKKHKEKRSHEGKEVKVVGSSEGRKISEPHVGFEECEHSDDNALWIQFDDSK